MSSWERRGRTEVEKARMGARVGKKEGRKMEKGKEGRRVRRGKRGRKRGRRERSDKGRK